jgi:hypothetical protein
MQVQQVGSDHCCGGSTACVHPFVNQDNGELTSLDAGGPEAGHPLPDEHGHGASDSQVQQQCPAHR